MNKDPSGDLETQWRGSDQEAASELFRRYANRLIALARTRLPAKFSRRIDPEDVVQSVYRSFLTGARDGRFDLQHGGDLWPLLVAITLRKVKDKVSANSTQKRGVIREEEHQGKYGLHAQVLAREPSPVEAAALTDQLALLMRHLDPVQRPILELRLQGHNLNEIAASVGCHERTVLRVLERVKQLLEKWYLETDQA